MSHSDTTSSYGADYNNFRQTSRDHLIVQQRCESACVLEFEAINYSWKSQFIFPFHWST
ncbi:hypothetical protein SO802_016523 [Lithocarpus litseifolius]|uniref:Uncharacterized protein n=1 Tax=Lithocarpus litseifolius TaxID=425828 RepID=A0AAW2CXD5_9ROSI